MEGSEQLLNLLLFELMTYRKYEIWHDEKKMEDITMNFIYTSRQERRLITTSKKLGRT